MRNQWRFQMQSRSRSLDMAWHNTTSKCHRVTLYYTALNGSTSHHNQSHYTTSVSHHSCFLCLHTKKELIKTKNHTHHILLHRANSFTLVQHSYTYLIPYTYSLLVVLHLILIHLEASLASKT